MNRTFSSKKPSSLPPPPTPTIAATSCSKRKQSPRSPLQDLNRVSSSSNSSYASSSVSSEAPRGCLRFLSSSSYRTPVNRPKNVSKTPNSLPHALASKQSKSTSSKENLPKGNARLQPKPVASDKARPNKKNPPCLYQWQSGKKSGSRTGQKSKPCSALKEPGKFSPRLASPTKKLKQKEDILGGKNEDVNEDARVKSSHSDASLTPLSKKVTGSDSDCTVLGDLEDNPNRRISRTPPIHNSVSPEIQCASSVVSKTTTPACYGAGYVVSGVTDRRKCRPRGILTVEENCSGFDKVADNSFDDDEKKSRDTNNNASPSSLPLPSEAVVCWLSSPRNKGKRSPTQKFENGLICSQDLSESTTVGSSTLLPSSSKTFWNVSDSSDLSGAASGFRRKMKSSISPIGIPEFQEPFDLILSPSYPSLLFSPNSTPSCQANSALRGRSRQHNLIDENSPFSLNSFGSGNVMQTPESDTGSDLHVGLSLVHADHQKEDNSNPHLGSFSKVLLSENFLLNSSMPPEDSVNSSFQFNCSTLPYESIDLSKLPKFLDDLDPWLSSSTIENASQSQMKISWREGSLSQLYEQDELDYCRCLSDDDDLANDYGINRLADPQVSVELDGSKELNSNAGITDIEVNEQDIDGLGEKISPALISCSGAESISTDGGGLVASTDDSDWTYCYLNKLFED